MQGEKDNIILERIQALRAELGLSQAAFARRLGMDPSNVSRILRGSTPVGNIFVDRLVARLGVDRAWLTGEEDDGETTAVALRREQPAGALVYDIDVTAGARPLAREFTRENCIGTISLPGLNPECPVVRVSGDSMEPDIPSGALISIRPVTVGLPLFWGQAYVVVLDDYRMVKYVRRGSDASHVVLHSANTAYDNIDIALADIRALFLVETVINVNRKI